MLKGLTKFAALLGIAALMLPAVALAHSGNDVNDDHGGRRNLGSWATNEFGVHVLGQKSDNSEAEDVKNDNDNQRTNKFEDAVRHSKENGDKDNGWHLGQKIKDLKGKDFISNLFYNGTVTATSSTGFTISDKDGNSFVVDADSASIIRIPRTTMAMADIQVGDAVHITGTKTGNDVNASVVYVMPANLKPAIAKGTVTAVTDNTLTVQTKDDTTITVNTDNGTEISNTSGNDVAQSDIAVGAHVGLLGLWDSVLNVFNAVKIKLF